MRKLTIIFLFLAVNVWFALGWTPPSPITPPDTIPDAIANMNFGITGGSVPAGAPAGDTYEVGELFSERFGTTGADGWDNTPTSTDESGTFNSDPDDQTALGVTGFVSDLWDVEVAAESNYVANHDLGAAYSTVYGRFYIYVDSETYGNSTYEEILGLTQNGGLMADGASGAFLTIKFAQNGSGDLILILVFSGDSSIGSGSNEYTISIDTPYRVEFYYNNGGAGTSTITWWVDDVSAGNPETPTQIGTRTNTTLSDVQDLLIGLSYNGSYGANFKWDTIDLQTTGRLIDE